MTKLGSSASGATEVLGYRAGKGKNDGHSPAGVGAEFIPVNKVHRGVDDRSQSLRRNESEPSHPRYSAETTLGNVCTATMIRAGKRSSTTRAWLLTDDSPFAVGGLPSRGRVALSVVDDWVVARLVPVDVQRVRGVARDSHGKKGARLAVGILLLGAEARVDDDCDKGRGSEW